MTKDCEGVSDVSGSWSFLNHHLGQIATEVMTRTLQLHRYFYQLDVQYSASSCLFISCATSVFCHVLVQLSVFACVSLFSFCFIKNDPLVILNGFFLFVCLV